MKNKQINKSKIISLSIKIFAVLFVFAGITYAFWTLSKEQTNPNVIVAKCLDLELTNETGTFGLASAWPVSDSEGASLPGYTFDVVNNCDEDIAYVIGMDSLEADGNLEYLKNSTVKISLDDTPARLFSELSQITHESNSGYTIRESKEIYTATVLAHESNTHNIKAWIKEDAPIEENNKVFSARVFITGGQSILDNNPSPNSDSFACFEIDKDGEIIGYNKNCGKSVVVPKQVDGINVRSISSDAFKTTENIYNYDFKVAMNSNYNPIFGVILNKERETEIINLVTQGGFGSLPRYYVEEEKIPALKNGELYFYYNVAEGLNGGTSSSSSKFLGEKEEKIVLAITELDLSKAEYLDTIKAGAFSTAELKTVTTGNCSIQEPVNSIDDVIIPKGLTKLTLGTHPNLKIGLLAFAGLDVKELNVYTTIKGYSECYLSSNLIYTHNPSDISVSSPFAYSNIDKLYISPNNSNTVFSPKTLISAFYNSIVGEITINEGITEISELNLMNNVRKINLPDSLEIIRDYTFTGTIAPTINIPSNILLVERDAFNSWPNTSTINVALTQAEAQDILNIGWNGQAVVNYKN